MLAEPGRPVPAQASAVPDSWPGRLQVPEDSPLVPLVEPASVASRLDCQAARPSIGRSRIGGDGLACNSRANDRDIHGAPHGHATETVLVVAANDSPVANTEPAGRCNRAASYRSANTPVGNCDTALPAPNRSRTTVPASSDSRLLRGVPPAL